MPEHKARQADRLRFDTVTINLAGLQYEHDGARTELIIHLPTEPVDMSDFLRQFSDYSAREQDRLGYEVLLTVRKFQIQHLLSERII